jgi:hypothetical protein
MKFFTPVSRFVLYRGPSLSAISKTGSMQNKCFKVHHRSSSRPFQLEERKKELSPMLTPVSGQFDDAIESVCSFLSSLSDSNVWTSVWRRSPDETPEELTVIVEEPFEIDERSVTTFLSRGQRLRKGRSSIYCAAFLAFFIYCFHVLFILQLHHRSTTPPSLAPAVPNGVPTLVPTDDRLNQVVQCASELSGSNITSADAVRWKAVEYFENGAGKNIDVNHCDDKGSFFSIMYSMIVLRESLNVDNPTWNDDKKPIVDISDVCRWKRLRCSPSVDAVGITDLLLSHADLEGTIPPEIAGLSELEEIVAFSNPKLIGSIPTELGLLTNMREIQLHFTDVTGQVPSELGNLSQLAYLRLYDTGLQGSMPSEVCSLRVNGNLTVLEADCTTLQCDCCTKCKRLGDDVLQEE